jgi:hypothetical protein
MTQKASDNLEMAIALPLGVAVSKLQKIEIEMRLLGHQAVSGAKERGNELTIELIRSRLEGINSALLSIKECVSVLERQLRTVPKQRLRRSTDSLVEDEDPRPHRKPYPELDD